VESSSSSIYSNIRTSSFPTATNTINNTILNNYNNNEGISTTTFNVPLVSHKEPLKKFMDVYLGYTPI